MPLLTALLAFFMLCAGTPAHAQQPVTVPQRPGGPKLDVDFEATAPVVARAMLDIAKVTADDVVMDLGCGEGDIPIAAAKLKGARAICVELDPERLAKAREKATQQGISDKITFIEGDLFKADLSPATVITLFLWDTLNVRLRPKLLDLKPGTRIVSHAHDMGDWRPDRTELHNQRSPDGPSAVHLWTVPAKVAGPWRLTIDGQDFELTLTQRYQVLLGIAQSGRARTALRNGRITGTHIAFDMITGKRTARIAGTLDGDRITPDSPASFEMTRTQH